MRFLLFLLPRSLGAPESERNRSQGQDLLFRGDRNRTGEAARRNLRGEPKPVRAAPTAREKRKQKIAAPPSAVRPVFRPSSEAVPERTRAERIKKPEDAIGDHGRIEASDESLLSKWTIIRRSLQQAISCDPA
jgi:hypothetical protein